LSALMRRDISKLHRYVNGYLPPVSVDKRSGAFNLLNPRGW
jgi:hypothetical protein